ncbi:hypothetical protein E2C01_043661 [Portunus trituberculatus]|uniref:Uncharacterized protein n=1 Tax=Portunus trituberculatus TaxID=210409 RepID=A0A5B7FWA2_PORTR|nr:hypothetical protein [Portunus trituberculatus]
MFIRVKSSALETVSDEPISDTLLENQSGASGSRINRLSVGPSKRSMNIQRVKRGSINIQRIEKGSMNN